MATIFLARRSQLMRRCSSAHLHLSSSLSPSPSEAEPRFPVVGRTVLSSARRVPDSGHFHSSSWIHFGLSRSFSTEPEVSPRPSLAVLLDIFSKLKHVDEIIKEIRLKDIVLTPGLASSLLTALDSKPKEKLRFLLWFGQTMKKGHCHGWNRVKEDVVTAALNKHLSDLKTQFESDMARIKMILEKLDADPSKALLFYFWIHECGRFKHNEHTNEFMAQLLKDKVVETSHGTKNMASSATKNNTGKKTKESTFSDDFEGAETDVKASLVSFLYRFMRLVALVLPFLGTLLMKLANFFYNKRSKVIKLATGNVVEPKKFDDVNSAILETARFLGRIVYGKSKFLGRGVSEVLLGWFIAALSSFALGNYVLKLVWKKENVSKDVEELVENKVIELDNKYVLGVKTIQEKMDSRFDPLQQQLHALAADSKLQKQQLLAFALDRKLQKQEIASLQKQVNDIRRKGYFRFY